MSNEHKKEAGYPASFLCGVVSRKPSDFVGEVGVSLYTGDSETGLVGRNLSSRL